MKTRIDRNAKNDESLDLTDSLRTLASAYDGSLTSVG
jgi:hypothetical protein